MNRQHWCRVCVDLLFCLIAGGLASCNRHTQVTASTLEIKLSDPSGKLYTLAPANDSIAWEHYTNPGYLRVCLVKAEPPSVSNPFQGPSQASWLSLTGKIDTNALVMNAGSTANSVPSGATFTFVSGDLFCPKFGSVIQGTPHVIIVKKP